MVLRRWAMTLSSDLKKSVLIAASIVLSVIAHLFVWTPTKNGMHTERTLIRRVWTFCQS